MTTRRGSGAGSATAAATDGNGSRLGATRPAAASAVQLRDVTVGYDGQPALESATLAVERGALLAVFGPNGGGKSTLLKVIAGLLKPWRGEVEVLGGTPASAAPRIAYVPQSELVDWSFPVSVWDVAMMGRFPGLGPFGQHVSAGRGGVIEALR